MNIDKILYVDDEPTLLEITKLYLENKYNFLVETEESPEKALELLENNNFDLIVSDYEMPGMNGIELLKRSKEEYPEIPFIIFTGRGREEVVIEALNEGADYYLQKGGDPKSQFAELSHKIRTAIEKKKADEKLSQDEKRFETLLEFANRSASDIKSLMDFALRENISNTESKHGYFAFVEEENDLMRMYSWSENAMNECRIENRTQNFLISKSGLWGEPVRKKRPIITNDYSADNPGKKGLPKGHTEITRHLGVPIFDGNRIVLLAGVANKEGEYDYSDIRQITLLMKNLWNIIKQREYEKEERRDKQDFLPGITGKEDEHKALYSDFHPDRTIRGYYKDYIPGSHMNNSSCSDELPDIKDLQELFSGIVDYSKMHRISETSALSPKKWAAEFKKAGAVCSEICTLSKRAEDNRREQCKEVQKTLREENRPAIWRCKSTGFLCGALPVAISGTYAGAWFFGCFRDGNSDERIITDFLESTDADEELTEKIISEFRSIKQISKEEYVNYINLVRELSCRITKTGCFIPEIRIESENED